MKEWDNDRKEHWKGGGGKGGKGKTTNEGREGKSVIMAIIERQNSW